jgi:hypothetical protein
VKNSGERFWWKPSASAGGAGLQSSVKALDLKMAFTSWTNIVPSLQGWVLLDCPLLPPNLPDHADPI